VCFLPQAAGVPLDEMLDGSRATNMGISVLMQTLKHSYCGGLLPAVQLEPLTSAAVVGAKDKGQGEARMRQLQWYIDQYSAANQQPWCLPMNNGGTVLLTQEMQGVLW
jgi:hypothetical protein